MTEEEEERKRYEWIIKQTKEAKKDFYIILASCIVSLLALLVNLYYLFVDP